MKEFVSGTLAILAICATIGGSNLIATTYEDVKRYQAEAIATYDAAIKAYDTWQTAIEPAKLAAWVFEKPANVTKGITEVKASAGGIVFTWLLYGINAVATRKQTDV